ncbi:hypothetical protein BU25DRAFT_409970 [Macroventuria anomochaeta]|uniref:Uncharacterized protein n=1 Tax=Macroventuria anomochaeta TaxID=301207 RepID=A0ACB6S5C6_9PLEO|nr:uncharacterized protein BU25DRAFT_409970 [Macroventuria anomochaeta]KAF2628404.1 hypothetical protein BU25DRAFT_409970 [Macroventuria anomochaeta]
MALSVAPLGVVAPSRLQELINIVATMTHHHNLPTFLQHSNNERMKRDMRYAARCQADTDSDLAFALLKEMRGGWRLWSRTINWP